MNKFAEHIKKQMGKKATVGYNAKPENMEEEWAINLAEEFDSAASLALEKAGLFWGGYSGEEERKERIEVIKKAISPMISDNFKRKLDPKIYDLMIEHLTDINSHIVVSAIEEIMKDKQASKCAKVTKKAETFILIKKFEDNLKQYIKELIEKDLISSEENMELIYGSKKEYIEHIIYQLYKEMPKEFDRYIQNIKLKENKSVADVIKDLLKIDSWENWFDKVVEEQTNKVAIKSKTNKLANIIKREIRKSAKTELLKQIGEDMWEYITDKYDFEVSTGYEGMYILDIFDHNIKDSNEAHIESEDSFLTLEEVEEFIKNYK